MVKGQHGFMQGYNAQAATNEHQIVIAAEIEVVSPDFGHLERTVTAARRELDGRGRHRAARSVVVADSGYWHTEQIATPHRRRHPGLDPRPTPGSEPRRARAGAAGSMTSCAASWPASTAKRSTGNANTSSSRCSATPNTTAASREFHRRGRAAVRTEWRLIIATHNLLKLHKHQIATTAA